jgi:hypothetical protein
MAKLYAELSSDKGGRVASKGGDTKITTLYCLGNKRTHAVVYEENFLTVFTLDEKGKSKDIKIFTT